MSQLNFKLRHYRRRPCFTLATTKGRQRSRRPPRPRRFVQSGSSTFRYGSPRLSSIQPGRDLERRGAVRIWLCNLGHCMRCTPSERCIRLNITCIRLWSAYLEDRYRTALARSCVRSRRKCPRVAWHLLRGRTSSSDGRIEAKPCVRSPRHARARQNRRRREAQPKHASSKRSPARAHRRG